MEINSLLYIAEVGDEVANNVNVYVRKLLSMLKENEYSRRVMADIKRENILLQAAGIVDTTDQILFHEKCKDFMKLLKLI